MSIKSAKERTVELYQKRAKRYDLSGIGSLEAKRKQTIAELKLKQGDLVIDIGCGTGLNFSHLEATVGSSGRIIGVDFSAAMLEQARQKIANHKWGNIELIQSDAADIDFSREANGIISTLALTFIPEAAQLIRSGATALTVGGRWAVMDMAWPNGWPLWLRYLVPGLSAYGITREIIDQQPWVNVWEAMKHSLVYTKRRFFWMGFFYIACGQKSIDS